MLHIILNASYRSLEGMVRKLSTYIPSIPPIDYTTIWKRGTKLDLKLSDTIIESDEPVVIAIDSTEITDIRVQLNSESSGLLLSSCGGILHTELIEAGCAVVI
jgi:hypothetical protein